MLIEQGCEKGIEKGVEIGREEGREEEQVKMILPCYSGFWIEPIHKCCKLHN